MKVAIMQPYIFPYIGYFQLVNAVDVFVFYDDVNFIKGGWINRNKILVNNKEFMFTIPLENPSSFSLINQTSICLQKTKNNNLKLLRTIEQSYKKAPYFKSVFPIVNELFSVNENENISELAIESVKLIAGYLELKTNFKISSLDFPDSKLLKKTSRIIEICKKENVINYINPIGGVQLYTKQEFNNVSIQLSFLKSKPIEYKQFDNEFVPWLSIIDVIMFNSKERVVSMLNEFDLY